MFYWLLKYVVLGPLLRLVYRPKVQGLENIPDRGPVILASNHLSFLDNLFIPLVVRRRVVFLGKAEYFDSPKTRWFFRLANVIPVRREGGSGAEAAVRAGVRALQAGQVVGIYPEGTRSPDGRLYRGKTGAARMALLARCPVVPLALVGTREVLPPERKAPRLGGEVRVIVGRPLRFDHHVGKESDRFVLRSITDEIMYEIMVLSGQEYVDEYASRVKAALARETGEQGARDRHPADAG